MIRYVSVYISGAVALTGGEFSESQAEIALIDVTCNSSELNLLSCSHNTQSGTECGAREDAGIVCQRMHFARCCSNV